MKKKRILVITAALLLIAAAIGGATAYYRSETQADTRLSAGNLEIGLFEKSGEAYKAKEGVPMGGTVMPGAVVNYPVYAKNTADYELYMRITIRKFWEDQDGNKKTDLDAKYIKLIIDRPKDWIIDDSDSENGEELTLYFRRPIKADENTGDILKKIEIENISSSEQNEYAGLRARVFLDADAVQKTAAQEAILSEWGLDVKIDENGVLNKVDF